MKPCSRISFITNKRKLLTDRFKVEKKEKKKRCRAYWEKDAKSTQSYPATPLYVYYCCLYPKYIVCTNCTSFFVLLKQFSQEVLYKTDFLL